MMYDSFHHLEMGGHLPRTIRKRYSNVRLGFRHSVFHPADNRLEGYTGDCQFATKSAAVLVYRDHRRELIKGGRFALP